MVLAHLAMVWRSATLAKALQLSVRKRTAPGPLDLLLNHSKQFTDDNGGLVRDQFESWLKSDGVIVHAEDEVTPFEVAGVLMKRVCQFAGHAWLELSQGTGPVTGAGASSRESINAHLAEFVPYLDPNEVIKAFDFRDLMPWEEVTSEHILRLFRYLLVGSRDGLLQHVKSDRTAAGHIPGRFDLASPEHLRQYSEGWFADRREAWITPTWEFSENVTLLESIRGITAGKNYSFTPEFYPETDNCVTWAARALDHVSPGDWLETIRTQCKLEPLADKKCEPYHVREHGRMGCTSWYASGADKYRRENDFRSFS